MSVPPLRLGNSFESYISGEVIIDPSAVIALGVILQAAPNSKIIIGAGVCVGMGSILQVHAGSLEIEAGASLGAGFLMVGAGKIGANACIGAATTVFECSVASGQVVPPGSILLSRSPDILDLDAVPIEAHNSMNGNNGKDSTNRNSIADGKLTQPEPETVVDDVKTDLWSSNRVPTMQYFRSKSQSQLINSTTIGNNTDNSQNQHQDQAQDQPSKEPTEVSTIQAFNEPAPESANNFAAHIYGQGNVQRLLVTLFPHRQSLNKSISDDSSD